MPWHESTSVNVDLGEKSYLIRIGDNLLEYAGQMIAEIMPGSKCVIVTDENVARLYLEILQESLASQNIEHAEIIVAPGEASKSFEVLQSVIGQILDTRFERNDVVIGLGGGVIGDLAGFAASMIRRGMNFVQIPTSLLAQVDSSVGGKTGINAVQGKNLIGAFLQPRLVIADSGLLKSLSKREFRAGYAEMVKYGLIDQPEFFRQLEENWVDVFSFGNLLVEAIAVSCKAKAKIVAEDQFERGCRALLNLGHTFGHALEAATGYDTNRLVHGESVAIGIILAHEFSNRMNLCDADSVERVRHHFTQVGLPTSIADIPGEMPDADKLLEYIFQDKKVSRGVLTFILTKGVGKSYIANNVTATEIQAFLKEKL
ncbi:MAG: 3-dehydroquinate synthase [Hyphomicrobiales bacterium]|nr:3-dehydroquinate synthase [Hyphomicrobiales bacterium]